MQNVYLYQYPSIPSNVVRYVGYLTVQQSTLDDKVDCDMTSEDLTGNVFTLIYTKHLFLHYSLLGGQGPYRTTYT